MYNMATVTPRPPKTEFPYQVYDQSLYPKLAPFLVPSDLNPVLIDHYQPELYDYNCCP